MSALLTTSPITTTTRRRRCGQPVVLIGSLPVSALLVELGQGKVARTMIWIKTQGALKPKDGTFGLPVAQTDRARFVHQSNVMRMRGNFVVHELGKARQILLDVLALLVLRRCFLFFARLLQTEIELVV